MNSINQRIVIAEYCGWTEIREQDYTPFGTDPYIDGPDQIWVGKNPKKKEVEFIPDYFNDLNAMHEVEKRLTIPEQLRFYQELCHILETNPDGTHKFGVCMYWETIHANAAQKAEAFLKTIGKWKE